MAQPIAYRIRHASPQDLEACLELRVQAENALAAAGIVQWHDREHGREIITGWIDQGAMHVVTTQAGDIIACFALAGADPAFWTPAEAVQPALYLYKFILRADRRGFGLGELLLDWCAQRAADTGARWLRLDCWRTNTGLHRYWLNHGFRQLDIREHPVRNSGALFERDAGTHLAPDTLRAAITLIDDTSPALTATAPMRDTNDRYDPTGEAAVWNEAATLVTKLKTPHPSTDPDAWNTALEQAARALENHGRAVRQAAGMYHRVISA
jgi:GNAT superfamily N-acetyltransferase